jgi:two-component system response regulator PilR (NtrC family)
VNERILVADDEEILRTNIREFLESNGYVVEGVGDGQAALERVLDEDYALVVADIRMPKMDGIALLKRIVTERPETFVLIMTAYASVDTAVKSLRLGAYDYLLKPIVFEDLLQRIQNLFAYRALKEEILRLRWDLSDRLGFEGIVGDSPAIRKVFDLVEKVAPTGATVLLTGESGTGKELAARAIHARSAVAEKEFLAVNMAALPRDTVEAQLFGHERGAFTGADRRRDGLLRSVGGGTVFLDEVGEVPVQAQAKLLRAVEAQTCIFGSTCFASRFLRFRSDETTSLILFRIS